MIVNRLLLVSTIALHYFLVVVLVYGGIQAIIHQPWYVSGLYWFFTVRLMTSRDRCILTEYENYCRLKLGLKPVKFVKQHLVRPVRVVFDFWKEFITDIIGAFSGT